MALLLAGVGIYGVTSYGVAQRTHEIGIRLALGASGDRVLREVVGRGARLTLVAVALGLVARGGDGPAGVGGAVRRDADRSGRARRRRGRSSARSRSRACYIPARRASRVDPVVALSTE